MAKQFGVSDEAIAGLRGRDLAQFPPAERAALQFADAMTRGTGAVDDALVDELRRHFSEPQIVEIACVAGLFNYFNRFNNAFRMDITLMDPDVLARRVEAALQGGGDSAERLGRVAEILQQGRRFAWVAIARHAAGRPGSGAPGSAPASETPGWTTVVTRGPVPENTSPAAGDAPGSLMSLIRHGATVTGALQVGCDRTGEILHEDRHVLERVAALLAGQSRDPGVI